MNARKLAKLVHQGCVELSRPCRSACALAAESLLDSTQPSTSAPASEPVTGHRIAHPDERVQPWLIWRRLHHTHRCQDKGCKDPNHHHHHQETRRPATLEEMEKACWSCDKSLKRGGLVCHGCKTIQPPDETLNYFDLFALPSGKFDLDPQLLERRYKSLQWNLHPDKMGHKPAEERHFSAQQASLINLAYSILKSPLARANYILALRGISAGDNFEGTIDDPELLMEVLEAREEVEATHDPALLAPLLQRNRQQQAGITAALAAAFRADDMRRAVQLTHQLQYLTRLEQEIVKKLPQL
ncbi:hypothetical protein Agub_g8565 [Astrephomene gubernaculifera]|uniref:J domain-containing protein n=1 Tax=Astrephomene gubernaculifera TaxID=47775 RepID=A0AAD3DS76_9CHLO|nr:hypothetical protein Agub_g8565 [Astrephomene gubernaculifera]